MKKLVYAAALSAAILSGCRQQDCCSDSARTNEVSCLCVGMETSKRFGTCTGCKLDSDRIYKMLSKTYGYPTVLLQSEKATKAAVKGALEDLVASTPTNGLFVFYYSGHGGQERLSGWGTSEPDGADAEDEYLCLYDTYLLDDDVWKILSKCRGRVFCVFDCCHSATMYRDSFASILPDFLKERRAQAAVPLGANKVRSRCFGLRRHLRGARPMGLGPRMLVWSGCEEAEYSYGGNDGGVLTLSILGSLQGASYDESWEHVKAGVAKRQPAQHPVSTTIGPKEAWAGEAFR